MLLKEAAPRFSVCWGGLLRPPWPWEPKGKLPLLSFAILCVPSYEDAWKLEGVAASLLARHWRRRQTQRSFPLKAVFSSAWQCNIRRVNQQTRAEVLPENSKKGTSKHIERTVRAAPLTWRKVSSGGSENAKPGAYQGGSQSS